MRTFKFKINEPVLREDVKIFFKLVDDLYDGSLYFYKDYIVDQFFGYTLDYCIRIDINAKYLQHPIKILFKTHKNDTYKESIYDYSYRTDLHKYKGYYIALKKDTMNISTKWRTLYNLCLRLKFIVSYPKWIPKLSLQQYILSIIDLMKVYDKEYEHIHKESEYLRKFIA